MFIKNAILELFVLLEGEVDEDMEDEEELESGKKIEYQDVED